jgi:ABC-2 type transport system ATP-binding protein
MSAIIAARGLVKNYGETHALDNVSFEVEPGRIVGLIGPNGAGKTTALKAILGLTPFKGDMQVLPKWLRVTQALDFVEGVHPKFHRARAEEFLQKTDIKMKSRVRELSKGMVTQLHLALILAIDAKLLVLDEPTLGLDLLYRRAFYDTLLNDYFNEERTIIITTHQVEEIENLLTDVMFINHGKIVLNSAVDALPARFHQVVVGPDKLAAARALNPIHEREVFGRYGMTFDGRPAAELESLGELRTPSIADLFVAMMSKPAQGAAA